MIKIKNIAAHPLDWNVIFEESLYQKVFPLVYQNIITIVPNAPPAGILKKYQAIYAKNATKNLYYSAFLIRMSKLFNERNIKFLPFRGPILSEDLYGGIEFRQFSDLDILVSKNDAIDAWQLLLDSGFQSELILNKSQRAAYIKVELNVRDSFINKLQYVFRLIFRPTDKDWLCCPVPGSFGFIHYVIRPFRLIYIQLSKLYA